MTGTESPVPAAPTSEGSGHFATHLDEMSLADERAAQSLWSEPDTLEVRGDEMSILQGTVGGLRRPALAVLAAAGAAAVLAVVVAAIVGKGRQDPPLQP